MRRAAFVRVKGEVAGYLNDHMGIIEYTDDKEKKINIFFHTEDVKVFQKDIRDYKKAAKTVLPVGCTVSVDARRVHVVGVKNIEYQVGYIYIYNISTVLITMYCTMYIAQFIKKKFGW